MLAFLSLLLVVKTEPAADVEEVANLGDTYGAGVEFDVESGRPVTKFSAITQVDSFALPDAGHAFANVRAAPNFSEFAGKHDSATSGSFSEVVAASFLGEQTLQETAIESGGFEGSDGEAEFAFGNNFSANRVSRYSELPNSTAGAPGVADEW